MRSSAISFRRSVSAPDASARRSASLKAARACVDVENAGNAASDICCVCPGFDCRCFASIRAAAARACVVTFPADMMLELDESGAPRLGSCAAYDVTGRLRYEYEVSPPESEGNGEDGTRLCVSGSICILESSRT